MQFLPIIAIAIMTMTFTSTAHADVVNTDLSLDPQVQTAQIIEVIEDVFADEPTSVVATITRICMCESGGRNAQGKPTGTIVHIEADGSIREGDEVPEDTGACQINPTVHSSAWRRENGFNQQVADDVVGNIRYALALIQDKRDRNVSNIWEDWGPSHSCWS